MFFVTICQQIILCLEFLLQTITVKDANQEVEIARCQKGQYFGELALVTNKPRAASAYAVGVVKCLGKNSVFLCDNYYQSWIQLVLPSILRTVWIHHLFQMASSFVIQSGHGSRNPLNVYCIWYLVIRKLARNFKKSFLPLLAPYISKHISIL